MAVTITVDAGTLGLFAWFWLAAAPPPPPPQAVVAATTKSASAIMSIAFDLLAVQPSTPANKAANTIGKPLKCNGRADACAPVETVIVTGMEAEALLRAAVAGVMEHAPPAGAPEQLSEMVPANPLVEVNARL